MRLGHSALAGMAMPETPIHKDSHSCGWENKVRFTEKRVTPLPTSDCLLAEDSDQVLFSRFVPDGFYLRHNP